MHATIGASEKNELFHFFYKDA